MDHRDGGHVQPHHGPELGGVVAGCVHDVLAHDPVAVVGALAVYAAGGGDDLPAPVGQVVHVGDQRVPPYLAAQVAGTSGHGIGAARRVGPAVVGGVEADLDIAEVLQQRMPLADLGRTDQVRLDTDLGEHGVDVAVPVDLVVGAGQPDGSASVPAGRQPGFLLQAGVQRHRLLMDLGHVQVADEVGDQSGRVPGGSRGQLTLLQQDGVGPTLVGQVVQQSDPHGPTADDHAPRLLRHGPS